LSATAGFASAQRYEDFEVERDYVRLRGPLLGLLRRDGWQISDDEWDVVWNAVCLNVWRRQQADQIDFRGEPLNYLLASAKNELRRERRRARPDVLSLDSEEAPEPSSPTRELDDELDLRDKLRLARTIARHRLRPRELRVWGLRVVCGLTYEEGGERLGITPKRFEKELLSAHAKIAEEIRAVAAGTWCESVKGVSLMRAYEAGVLDPDGDALRELREHAATCPACRRAIKTVEGIVPILLPPAPVLLALSGSAPAGDGHAERLMQHLIEDGGELVTAAPAEHPVVHAPSIVERALEFARLTAGRHGGAVAETAPASSSAAELVGSASAGGAALGSGLVAKLLVAGGVAVCAIGGQEICAELLGSPPTPRASKPHIVALRPKFPHSVTPSVKAAQAQPRAGATAAQQIAHRARVATIHRAQRRALARSSQRRALARSSSSTTPSASPPAASAASAAPASSSDPTFSSTAPTTSRPSGSSAGGGSSGGGSSGGSGSSSDSTFQGLP
jgi:RNA polymerase sigma factor (sigma-70 family)